MNIKLRFGHTPTDFWDGRDTDSLTEFCDVDISAPDVETAINAAVSLIAKITDDKGLDVVWEDWQEPYFWRNPYVPELQSATIRERYSKPTLHKKGRYYTFLSTNEHSL